MLPSGIWLFLDRYKCTTLRTQQQAPVKFGKIQSDLFPLYIRKHIALKLSVNR
jgi:hypothetical protein